LHAVKLLDCWWISSEEGKKATNLDRAQLGIPPAEDQLGVAAAGVI